MGIQRQAAWFQHLGLGLGSGKNVLCEKLQEVDADPFEAIDAMERGLGCESTASRFVQPEPSDEKKRRMMTVTRSADRLHHTLLDEDLKAVLTARTVMDRDCVEIFVAGGNAELSKAQEAAGPAFTLTFEHCPRTAFKTWQLASHHCEHCGWRAPHLSCAAVGGQTLARVSHSKEEIGDAKALCMDAEIPLVDTNGCRECWCPMVQKACESGRAKHDAKSNKMELSSERPKWSKRLGALTMDFNGRAQAASVKNFKLCLGENTVLIYGKRTSGDFCLDFEHPLSTVQAFALALTTQFWK